MLKEDDGINGVLMRPTSDFKKVNHILQLVQFSKKCFWNIRGMCCFSS